jgi:hypothetical protein
MIVHVVDSFVYDGELELELESCREISNLVQSKPCVCHLRTAHRLQIV